MEVVGELQAALGRRTILHFPNELGQREPRGDEAGHDFAEREIVDPVLVRIDAR